MNVHVFAAKLQPATKYVDHNFDKPRTFRNHPRRLLRCASCGVLRWAKNLLVQVYYDIPNVYSCKEGHFWYRNRCHSNAQKRSR